MVLTSSAFRPLGSPLTLVVRLIASCRHARRLTRSNGWFGMLESIDVTCVRILHSFARSLALSHHSRGGPVDSCAAPDSKTRVPRFKMPALACDAHCHVFGPAAKFPYAPNRAYTPPDAPKERLEMPAQDARYRASRDCPSELPWHRQPRDARCNCHERRSLSRHRHRR